MACATEGLGIIVSCGAWDFFSVMSVLECHTNAHFPTKVVAVAILKYVFNFER